MRKNSQANEKERDMRIAAIPQEALTYYSLLTEKQINNPDSGQQTSAYR